MRICINSVQSVQMVRVVEFLNVLLFRRWNKTLSKTDIVPEMHCFRLDARQLFDI